MPRILIASDLSARSDRPLDRARLLAAQLSGSVILLHVYESDVDDRAGQEARLRRLIAEDLGEHADRVEILLSEGEVPETIARIASQRDCRLIVTGVARFNSPADFIVGTTVDHLVRSASIPVLVVKRRARNPYRHLLVATDFSDCSRTALEAASGLFPDAALTLVHSYHAAYEAWIDPEDGAEGVGREAAEEMAGFVDGLGPELRDRVQPKLVAGELHSAIEKAMLDNRFDLLVLGTHGRGGFAHATIGSRASELLAFTSADVLMVRRPRSEA